MKGVIFTYALVALGVFGAFRSPLIALAVYVCLAVVRPHYMWGFAANMSGISQWVGVALLVAWVLHRCGSWQFGRARIIVVSLTMFAVWATISATMATLHPGVAWGWTTNLWKFVLPFLVGATLIRSETWIRRMLWVIVMSQGYVAYEMNYAYLVDHVNRIREAGYGGMDNNSFGIALVTTLGPALALAIAARNWIAKAIAVVAGVLILHAALLTFSRGAMVGLLAVAFMAFVIMPKRPANIAVIVAALLVALRLTGPELMTRYGTVSTDQESLDDSAASRLELWKDCLDVAVHNPIFGLGPYQWPYMAVNYGWTPFKSAHSVWAQTMAELGFPGVGWLALFFAMTFIKLWPIARNRGKTPEDRERAALATGIMLSAVGFSVSGQFVTLGGLEVPYYIAMVGVGMLAITPQPSTVPASDRAATRLSLPAINLPTISKPSS